MVKDKMEELRKVEIEWRGKKVAVNMGELLFGHHYLANQKAKMIPRLDPNGSRILGYDKEDKPDSMMLELWIIVLALQRGSYDKKVFPATFEEVFFLEKEEGKKLYEYYLKHFGKKKEDTNPNLKSPSS